MSRIEPPTSNPALFWSADPLANALKSGTLADLPRVPEDAQTIHDRTMTWYDGLKPQRPIHCWLVEQVTLTTIRIEHDNRIERRQRDRAVLRARQFWDDDRKLDAILLGEKLAKSPARVVNQLKRTPHGCDYLIDRWRRLERIAEAGHEWDEAQCSLAFHLLGIPDDERVGCGIDVTKDSLATAREELLALRQRKEEVAGLDALDRAMAEADYVDVPSEEVRRVRRHTAELQRWLRWCLERIDKQSPHQHTSNWSHEHFMAQAEPAADPTPAPAAAPEPKAEAPDLVIVGETEDQPEETTEAKPEPIVSDRRREGLKKAEARREARRRKLDRRRA